MWEGKNRVIAIGMGLIAVGAGVGYGVAKVSATPSTLVSTQAKTMVEVLSLPSSSAQQIDQAIVGKVESVYQAKLGTAVAGSYLEKLHVREGDSVKKGTVLAEVRQDLTTSAVGVSRLGVERVQSQRAVLLAQMAEATLNATQAQEQYERSVKLKEVGSVSQEAVRIKEVDAQATKERVKVLEAQLVANQAEIKSAQLSLQDANVRQGYTRIVAPFDGKVVKVNGALGEQIAGDIVQLNSTETRATFKTNVATSSQPYTLSIDAKRVSSQSATVDNITTLYADYQAEQGRGVKGVISYTFTGVKVPTAALVKREGQWRGWFAVKDKAGWKAVSRAVSLAPVVSGQAIIEDVLAPQSKLITSGVDYLQENQPIAIKE